MKISVTTAGFWAEIGSWRTDLLSQTYGITVKQISEESSVNIQSGLKWIRIMSSGRLWYY